MGFWRHGKDRKGIIRGDFGISYIDTPNQYLKKYGIKLEFPLDFLYYL